MKTQVEVHVKIQDVYRPYSDDVILYSRFVVVVPNHDRLVEEDDGSYYYTSSTAKKNVLFYVDIKSLREDYVRLEQLLKERNMYVSKFL